MWLPVLLPILLVCSGANAAFNADLYAVTPKDQNATAGATVLLKCQTSNPVVRGVQWTQDGFGLGPDRELGDWPHGRYKMKGNTPYDWNLEITNVTADDDAIYDCQVPGSRSPPAKLTVFTPPRDPYILGGPVKEVIENTMVKIECVADGAKPAATINWLDASKNLINTMSTTSLIMPNSKVFSTTASFTIYPNRAMHGQVFTCEAWNAVSTVRKAKVRIEVKYAPSVEVKPLQPGPVREGEKARFQCHATSNPPPFSDKYRWFLDDRQIPGQFGFYYEIFNVTKNMQGKQVKCSVENELGVANGVRTIQVEYAPWFVMPPKNVAGNEMESVVLRCKVDSNPKANYHWTKGTSREIIGRDQQNLTLLISSSSVGIYFCHATVPGFPPVRSSGAEVRMNARPIIQSDAVQKGSLGDDVQVNCAALSVPEYQTVKWYLHGKELSPDNPHYRIIVSPMQNGVHSTLIIRQSIDNDFNTYTCSVANRMGETQIHIQLEMKSAFPPLFILICSFTSLILLLVTAILILLCRRRFCKEKKPNKKESVAANNLLASTNHLEQQFAGDNINGKKEVDSFSNEADSAWEGSDDNPETVIYGATKYNNIGQPLISENEPDFPPKPDVVSNGYIPYGTYVRDFNPPINGPMCGQDGPNGANDPIYSCHRGANYGNVSTLNVTDPRFSAIYGNPYLRQNGQYSTFLPPTTSTLMPSPRPPPTSFSPPTSLLTSSLVHLSPMSNSNSNSNSNSIVHQSSDTSSRPASDATNAQMCSLRCNSSTPTSSLSNMGCLVDDRAANSATPPKTISNINPISNADMIPMTNSVTPPRLISNSIKTDGLPMGNGTLGTNV